VVGISVGHRPFAPLVQGDVAVDQALVLPGKAGAVYAQFWPGGHGFSPRRGGRPTAAATPPPRHAIPVEYGVAPLLESLQSLAQQGAVNVNVAVADLHLFSRQTDDTLDIRARRIGRVAKDDQFPSLGTAVLKCSLVHQQVIAGALGDTCQAQVAAATV